MNDPNFCKQDGIDLKSLFTAQIDNVKTLIDANDKNYNQRFENVIQATQSALNAADRAVNKAESAAEKRFEGVNEFRATLADQQRTLMPRSEVEILVKGINERIEKIENANLLSTGTSKGINTSWAFVIGAISTIALLLNVVNLFIAKK